LSTSITLIFTFNSNLQLTHSINMSKHIQLNSKAEFDEAIQEKGKYVFIYCYEGQPSAQAEE
jgi:hypothetical protein